MTDDRKKVRQMFCGAWRPPDRRPAWEWAEEHVKKIPYSPIPGPFRSENSPWIRKPLEALTDVGVRKVQIIAGIQAAKTFGSEIGTCYILKNAPGPLLWLDQNNDEAKDELDSRLKDLWKNCPPVAELVPGDVGRYRHDNKRDKVKFLHGMTGWFLGAHNIKNLQRRSIRWLIGDETWGWPKGHMKEAEARVTAFGWLGKIFFSSQAGEENDDTHESFNAGSQEEWNFVCMNKKCEEPLQPYLWENVEWDKKAKRDDGTWDFDRAKRSARIVCPSCGHEHDTNHQRIRNQMNDLERGADFVVMNPNAPSDYRSFHWNSLCSVPIGTLVELYLQAKAEAKKGDIANLKIFYQKRLALPWNDLMEDFKLEIDRSTYLMGDEWDQEAVIWQNGKITNHVPALPERDEFGETEEEEENFHKARRWHSKSVGTPCRGRLMLVDTQRDHFWCCVFGFDPAGNVRLYWCGGGRNNTEKGVSSDHPLLFWDDLDKVAEEWDVAPHLVMVDAGYDTSRVYEETANRGWTSLMGDQRATFTHRVRVNPRDPKDKRTKPVERFYSPMKRANLGGKYTKTFFFSNLNIKDIVARIRGNQNPDDGPTFEVPDDVPDWYLAQMDSEQRVKKPSGKYIWEQIGKRPNHAWDCTVMAYVALVMMKLLGRESVADGDPEEGEEGSEKED